MRKSLTTAATVRLRSDSGRAGLGKYVGPVGADSQLLVRPTAGGHGSPGNNNNNNRISIAPYGRNFRGAGGRSDQCSVKA